MNNYLEALIILAVGLPSMALLILSIRLLKHAKRQKEDGGMVNMRRRF